MKFTDNDRYKENVILKLSFEFAIDVVKYSEELDKLRKFTFSKQIIRSGTSIGANVKEAQNAESKADFIHKLKIALKEADELEYWLYLCQELDGYPSPEELLKKLNGIIKVLNKIISKTRQSMNTKP